MQYKVQPEALWKTHFVCKKKLISRGSQITLSYLNKFFTCGGFAIDPRIEPSKSIFT